MVKKEWGTKRHCQSCGARFYDLGREPIVCPKCETLFVVETPKPRAPSAKEARRPEPKAPVAAKVADDAAEEGEEGFEVAETEDEDEEFLEDASELDKDEDVPLEIDPEIEGGGREP